MRFLVYLHPLLSGHAGITPGKGPSDVFRAFVQARSDTAFSVLLAGNNSRAVKQLRTGIKEAAQPIRYCHHILANSSAMPALGPAREPSKERMRIHLHDITYLGTP